MGACASGKARKQEIDASGAGIIDFKKQEKPFYASIKARVQKIDAEGTRIMDF